MNVPLSKGVITDDTRIRGSIPTIQYLLDRGAKVLLTSHLGRPKGGYEEKFSLAPIAPRLSQLLGKLLSLLLGFYYNFFFSYEVFLDILLLCTY